MSPNSDSILSQELSRRTALKALFGAASAAVLFGLPARAHAAEATKETTDKLNAAQAQLDEVQAQLDSIANEYAALANKTPRPSTISRAYRARLTARRRRLTKRRPSSKRSAAIFPIAFPPAISRAAPTSCRCCSPRARLRSSSPMRTMLRRSTRATATPSRTFRPSRKSSMRKRPSLSRRRPTWRSSRISRLPRCRTCRPSSRRSRRF